MARQRGRGPGYYDEGGVWVSTAHIERELQRLGRQGSRNRRSRSNDGRWRDSDGSTHTVNPTSDPRASGGYYHSVDHGDGTHDTTVYNPDGTLADVKANRYLEDRDRQ